MSWKKKDTQEKVDLPEQTASVPKQKKAEEKQAVVAELPQVAARKVKGDDGKIYHLITKEEAIHEILEGVRELIKRTEE